jgi:hypothetical protein
VLRAFPETALAPSPFSFSLQPFSFFFQFSAFQPFSFSLQPFSFFFQFSAFQHFSFSLQPFSFSLQPFSFSLWHFIFQLFSFSAFQLLPITFSFYPRARDQPVQHLVL